MIEFLNQIDTNLFLFLNSLHHPKLDPIMLIFSYSNVLLFLLLILLLAFGYFYYKKWIIVAFVCCLLAFGVSDRISSGIFKPTFKRLRPCHNQILSSQVYLAGQNCWGGKFGFISSHAANSFTLAMFFWLLFKRKNRWFSLLFLYATIVSYSRIYLAKHYPGDILVGSLLGLLCGYLGYKAFTALRQRYQDQPK